MSASVASSSRSPRAGRASRASAGCSWSCSSRGPGTHPVKEFLRGWYTRIGYRHVRTGRLEDDYPALEPLLATPCDFPIFHKDL